MGGQNVEYPFNVGLDEGTDPRRTPKFISVQNFVWSKRGLLEKRNGYTTLPTTIAGTELTSSVASVTVTSGGSGYTGPFIVTATGGGGAGFVGIASVTAGAVTVVGVFTSLPGWGYTSAPTLDFAVGGGTGATATAILTTPGTPANLVDSQTICQTPGGALQVADGTSVYSLVSGQWATVGSVPNVGVTTVPTPLKVQPPDLVNPSVNPFNWYVVLCAGRYVWWAEMTGPLVVNQASGVIVPTSKGVNLSGGGTSASGNVVTDGSRWSWKFKASLGGSSVSFQTLDMSSTVPHEVGSSHFPDSFTSTICTVFDAVWDAPRSRLVTAYVITGDTHITVRDWTWSIEHLGWVAGSLNQTFTLSTATFAAVVIAVNVCSDGKAMVAWGYYETNGSLSTYVKTWVDSLHFATPYVVKSSDYTSTIVNVTIAETNGGADYHVAFTGQDWVQSNPGGSVPGPVGVLVDDVRSFRITRDVPGIVVNGTITSGTTLATRLFVQGGAPHALIYAGASLSYEVIDLSGVDPVASAIEAPGRVIAYINPRTAFQGDGTATDLTRTIRGSGTLATAVALSANKWMVPTTFAPEPDRSAIMQLQACTLDYTKKMSAPVQEWTGLVYPTSVPSVVATKVRQTQFLSPPVIVKATRQAGGGGLSAGNYAWVVTYSLIADDGSIVESAPSSPFTVVGVAANDAVSLYVSTYGLNGVNNSTSSDVFMTLYRTLVNQGSAFYRVFDPYTTSAGSNRTQFPALGVGDLASDILIEGNPQLYTGGGYFDNISPPSCSIAARVRNRVYLAGTPDGFTAYFSDAITDSGAGAANFHDENQIVVDSDGPITAIAGLDDKTIIFKASAIYVVYGSEGGANGNGNTLSTPTRIPSGGIGCVSQASVVTTPAGLMFQSTRGIEMLDRALNVTFVGEPVKDETAGKSVVAGVLVPEQYQVRFYMSDWSTAVLSTLNGEWVTFAYASQPTATISGAVNASGAIYWCGNGHVMQETPGVYSDNGSNIGAFWQSGWITLGELEGYRRYTSLQLLGKWFDETNIQVFILTDYRNDNIQTATWTSTDISAMPEFDENRLQIEVSVAIQKAEAVSIALFDEGPADGTKTKGVGWEAMTFEVVQKPGRYRKLSNEASR